MTDAPWFVVGKGHTDACALADRHYSRRSIGAPQFMPPGQTLVLLTPDRKALFGWWRPHPTCGIRAMNGLDGWTCTIFRNEGAGLSSALIVAAEHMLLARHACGPDGLLSYVWNSKVRSANPGYCFRMAGYTRRGWSADGRKSLWHKPAYPVPPLAELTQATLFTEGVAV
jgi:hypothetical protein